MTIGIEKIEELLGNSKTLLDHKCEGIPADSLHLPGSDIVDRIFINSDRPAPVLRNMQAILNTGRLAGTMKQKKREKEKGP